jgi:ATP-binding cassette subfamily B protein
MKNKVSHVHFVTFIFQAFRFFPKTLIFMGLVAIFGAMELSLTPYIFKVLLDQIGTPTSHDLFRVILIPLVVYLSVSFFTVSMRRVYGYYVEIKMIPCSKQSNF